MHDTHKLRPDVMLVELTDIQKEFLLYRLRSLHAGDGLPLLDASRQSSRPRKGWIIRVEGESVQAPDTSTNTGAKTHSVNTYRPCCWCVETV